ncbi:MAG: c-type cytochrome [Deltaproteobacteria bacterium]|nr:c-type cytochrome [Deltaproteobacteria bacterium]
MKALWLFLLVACNSNAAPPAGTPPARGSNQSGSAAPLITAASTGSELYAALCAKCHAENLQGGAADHAPSLITTTFLETATDDFLHQSIARGRPGTSMAAYSKGLGGPLEPAAIQRIVKFIRERGNVPAKAPMQSSVVGDAKLGAAIYDASCKVCHGDRSFRGEGIHLANPVFLEQASDPFMRHAIMHGRPGTKMMAFGNTLNEKQISDVIAYVRTFAVTAAPKVAQLPPPTGKEPLVIFPGGKQPDWKPRENRYVPVDVVKKAYDEKRAFILIDARPPSDWMRARITGAVSIPYHDLKRLAEIPKDTWVIAYCACPHHLSGDVVDALKKMGHTKAAILDEGINDWHRKGYPMTAAEGVEKPALEPAHDHNHHPH